MRMDITAAVFQTATPSLRRLTIAAAGPREVRVRMVATGICHTDLKAAGPDGPVPRPVVLGHEGAGIVESVGSAVAKVAPGDPVVMTFASCGVCAPCRDAHPAYCVRSFAMNFGCSHGHLSAAEGAVAGGFFGQSSFATLAIATERNVVKVRADAPLAMLGPLGCGIQTGAGAVLNDLAVRPGMTLAVFGTGSLGLAAVMAARIAGASRIVAVDRIGARLDLARDLGATDTILAGDDPVAPAVLAAVPGGVDRSLDTTGALPVMRQAIDVLAPRGVCGFVTGPWDGRELGVAIRPLLGGRSIRGIHQGDSNPDVFIPLLVDLFMAGQFPFDRLVSLYPFDRIADALADSASGAAVKAVVTF